METVAFLRLKTKNKKKREKTFFKKVSLLVLRVKGAGYATLGAEGRHTTCVEGPAEP